MFKNYIKITLRNIRKQKAYSFINIFGLSIGLACCMLISIYLLHEFSYDSHHKNVERLYQLCTVFVREGQERSTANTPARMAEVMQQEFPEIEKTTRLLETFADDKTLLQYKVPEKEIKSFYETNGFLADPSFFELFAYKFKEGDPLNALANPNSVVLSEEIALKLFGNQSALNKIIHINSSTNGEYDFKVTGVFIPSEIPTHIDARFIMTIKGGDMEQYMNRHTELASNNMFYTYFLLKPGTNAAELEKKFPAFIDKHAGKDLKAMGFNKIQFLTPVKDIHLFAKTASNVTPAGSITYLYILASVAVFTLLIAVINFMNLSTARSAKRSAEVGVRKVLGAEKKSLIKLFLGESLMMAMIAFVFAISLAQISLPLFSEMLGADISLTFNRTGILGVAGFFILAVFTGLLAGSYPAFYLSSFSPVKVFKGKSASSFAAVSLRRVLVVFQFVISIALIISTIIISSQMGYMHSKDLGFSKEQQIIIPLRSTNAKNIYSSLKEGIHRIPQISSAGASLYYPGIFNPSDMSFYRESLSMNESVRFFMNWVDDSFLQTLNIKPVAGRLFSKEFPADTNFRVILNEEGIRQLKFESPEQAVGQFVYLDWRGENYKWEIIGVVKNFHFKGLQENIEPYGVQLATGPGFNYLIAHAGTNDISKTLSSIEAIWNKLNPSEPFEYSFLDQDFRRIYESESQLASTVNTFTIIAIIISCLGLFGLAAFSAEQRTKEIGVRKVLGAGVSSIITLLSKDFLKLVLIAIVLATPLAWYIMDKWLQDFAYRIEISWWMLLMAWLLALLIAFITVGFQAVKAAAANPIKSLKYE
ncbi:MAG: ABC transporter permease [Ignavibacteriaceae bacterium]